MPSRKDLANAIRALSMDAVQKANSGHPGAPMGMADIAEVLWNDYLLHNPANPAWPNRDRFVLSNGHGSMLIYSLLHLSGYDLSINDLQNFRQLHSKTPGHPEYGYAPGVETTTGPLGQGLANAVGMALAERTLSNRFNKPGYDVVDHYTYAFMGDGCLMEGISHEACSLAGTMGLGKLIAFYDDNGISIDGEVEGWYTDNVPQRFESYGWQVVPDIDGHDADAVKQAIEDARRHSDKPTLICCKTLIGWGSPNKQGTESCHGAALGDDEVALVRETIGWPHPPFEVPEGIYQGWDAKEKGRGLENDWNNHFDEYARLYPQLAEEFRRRQSGQLPEDWEKAATDFIHETDRKAENIASRKASQNSISAYAPLLPELIGGSADLAASNLTLWPQAEDVNKGGVSGNYVFYGVREFGMSAIMNGLSLYGGLIPFGATFLTFSDYSRNALRMAALMKTRAIHVFTHDSIGLGEDGPTHQPVEHLASLRLIPNMQVWRPCDAVESAVAWKVAIENREGPTCLIFSRQGLPHQSRSDQQLENITRGGYTLLDCDGEPEAILIATGSEVSLATEAAGILSGQGKRIRVVSMPSTNTFAQQDNEYRESVLPSSVTSRISVEAGSTDSWYKYIGLSGKAIGVDRFGESAPAGDLFREFNLTVDHVVEVVSQTL
ncbi:MAG: transketolase [Methylococcales bacterium]|nr:transketolase [Methylococcales bacterium]